MDCIFCKIINGEISSYTIYEDDVVKAFLDINPVNDGHTLIIPKKHFENMYDIDIETQKHIEMVSKKIGELLKDKIGCKGITRIQNNEYGQDVKHYHMHLIPRYENDGIALKPSALEVQKADDTYKKITM